MFLEIVMKALRGKNPQEYRRLQGTGELREFAESLNRSATKAYQALAANLDENGKAMVREVVIAQIVEEIERPPSTSLEFAPHEATS